MIRSMEVADRSTVRNLQKTLRYYDPDIVDAAIDGPFLGVLAIERSTPVGYAVGFPGNPTTLVELGVAEAYRRQGYGRALVNAITSMSDGSVVVHTPTENRIAQEFYTT